MRRFSPILFTLALTSAPVLSAQQGPAPTPAPMMGVPGAEMFLSQAGPLQLTDQQVVRLAAIARRADDRRKALRTRLDSLRPRVAPGDSAGRRERRVAPPMDLFEREREASHNDLRDALAVLTADQQARAWEMMAARRAFGWPRDAGRGSRGEERGLGRHPGAR